MDASIARRAVAAALIAGLAAELLFDRVALGILRADDLHYQIGSKPESILAAWIVFVKYE